MKIFLRNREQIEKALATAQGRARVRLLDIEDLEYATAGADTRLEALDLPKKYWCECSVTVRPEAVANSYFGRAEGTQATLVRYPSGWALVGVSRVQCDKRPYGGGGGVYLSLTDEAHAALKRVYPIR